MQLKKKQAALKSDLERALTDSKQATEEAATMKSRCQRALAKARDKYNRLKAKLEEETTTRSIAEDAVRKLKEEYEKLQRSTDIRMQQLMMQMVLCYSKLMRTRHLSRALWHRRHGQGC